MTRRNFSQYYSYFHQGLDIALPLGNAVYASDTGTVSYAGWNSTGYGYLVVVNHGRGISTYYAHLSDNYVYVGQVVRQGDVIAATGNTGNSSGPHIHFEIRVDNGRRGSIRCGRDICADTPWSLSRGRNRNRLKKETACRNATGRFCSWG